MSNDEYVAERNSQANETNLAESLSNNPKLQCRMTSTANVETLRSNVTRLLIECLSEPHKWPLVRYFSRLRAAKMHGQFALGWLAQHVANRVSAKSAVARHSNNVVP
jgi:hypothetical protein